MFYDALVKHMPGWLAFIILGYLGGTVAYLVAHRQYLKQIRVEHKEQIALKNETIMMLEEAKEAAKRGQPQEIFATLQRIEKLLMKLCDTPQSPSPSPSFSPRVLATTEEHKNAGQGPAE